jgi:RoxA-like, cytochrome c-like
MTALPVDDTIGAADFPSIWNLQIREGKALNWGGETPSPRSVIIDSALGLGAPPGAPFLKQMDELEAWLKALPPPKYPYTGEHGINEKLVAAGRTVWEQHCASCHAPGGERTGAVIPIAEIGTDRERLDTWTQQAADTANRVVKQMGITRIEMVKTEGYASPPLDGVWLRAPYLHNGSVPNLRDLLEPEDKRTKTFYRGYDVYDPVNVGFVSQGCEAERRGYRFDTRQRGNGNQGHRYGTSLSAQDKQALIEYLKTL